MSRTIAIAGLVTLLVGAGPLFTYRQRQPDRIIVAPQSSEFWVDANPVARRALIAEKSTPMIVGSTSTVAVGRSGSTAFASPAPAQPIPGTLPAPTAVPAYVILDDTGNKLTLEELQANPQPVTLYLQRGSTNVPVRLDADAASLMAAREAAVAEANIAQQQGNASNSSPTALESALAQTSMPSAMEQALGVTSTPSAMESAIGVTARPSVMEQTAGTTVLPSGVLPDPINIYGSPGMTTSDMSAGVPGIFSVNGFGRRGPVGFVQTFDVNGNLGWYPVNSGFTSMFAPRSFSFLNPTITAVQQTSAAVRAENSLAEQRLQQSEFAADRAAQTEVATRAAVTVR